MAMGAANIALMGMRVVVVLIGLAIVGLGAWAKVIIHDMEVRGNVILETVLLRPESQEAWRQLFDAAVNSQLRIWVAIAAGCFISITTLLIILSQKTERMHMSPYLAIPLEFIAMLTMGAAFGATLSLTLKLGTPELVTAPAPDLKSFGMLLPLSKGYAIAAGAGLMLLLMTSMSAIIQTCHRARDSRACSFEPTASALGMGHGYQAELPKKSRGPIPTLYDPNMPLPDVDPQTKGDEEEKGLAAAAADMGRRDSVQIVGSAEDKEISGPLGLQRPEDVAHIRPARPWSEMPKRR
ncbi:hypothetical protein K458DRAFT_410567 [Lentithecium fluviatile CBS 122367]|uniref:Uncharacterized protein n=1 Tax=Lentithecium fluviatile CBS 122367 TaxID=1168545 RepID=A0A6G1IEF7_9PLEO|nr:hypothetical protein K458DRAFT_410567 [Lentithecium fluviatile CBS 122367]